ncbi:hypothetical protein KJ966_20225 [bacterium]|nr:hypothetical protein [bacterium]
MKNEIIRERIITNCFRLKISILMRKKEKLPADHGSEEYSNTTLDPLPEGDGWDNRRKISANSIKTRLNVDFTFLPHEFQQKV